MSLQNLSLDLTIIRELVGTTLKIVPTPDEWVVLGAPEQELETFATNLTQDCKVTVLLAQYALQLLDSLYIVSPPFALGKLTTRNLLSL